MDNLPEGMTYAGLGITVLGVCGVLVYAVVKIVLARLQSQSNTSNELDARSTLLIKEATGAWQQLAQMQKGIIDEERAEKLRAQDEREAITKQFIEYSTQQDNIHRADMDKIREESRASAERVHMRLDECNARDATNATKLSEAMRRLEMLEANERAAYNAMRQNPAVQPVQLVQPLVTVQPQG